MKIILASKSPRRKQLLSELGYTFTCIAADIDETPPNGVEAHDLPLYLSNIKAKHIAEAHSEDLIIAADTLVILGNEVLGKPDNEEMALNMLRSLSGNQHEVITGVTILSPRGNIQFQSSTKVTFAHLTDHDIRYYIQHYQPFDKAGSYAIQEWIGMIGIERIDGDYYNVMGLPVNKVFESLKKIL